MILHLLLVQTSDSLLRTVWGVGKGQPATLPESLVMRKQLERIYLFLDFLRFEPLPANKQSQCHSLQIELSFWAIDHLSGPDWHAAAVEFKGHAMDRGLDL